MGIPIEVSAPRFRNTGVLSEREVQSLIYPEDRPWTAEPRTLVTVVSKDFPGAVREILGALHSGPSPITVDGALCSTVHGIGSFSFMVRSVDGGVELDVDKTMEEIKVAVNRRLREVDPSPSDAKVRCCLTQRPPSTEIFQERRFTEFRFIGSDGSSDLMEAAVQFARILGEQGLPIAYLHYPERGRDGERFLRVGVGMKASPEAEVDLDIDAMDVAERTRVRVKKFFPSLSRSSFDDRMELLYAPTEAVSRSRLSQKDQGLPPCDVVVTIGEGRPGLVATQLSQLVGLAGGVRGGSMTVLSGFTIASWVLPVGTGRDASRALAKVAIDSDDSPAKLDVLEPFEGVLARPELLEPTTHIWLAWSCPDRAGQMRAVIDASYRQLDDSGVSPDRVDVDYALARVIQAGTTCIGKVHLRLRGTVDADDVLSRIEDGVMAALTFDLSEWPHARPTWVARPVVVATREPGEEPWAGLAIL